MAVRHEFVRVGDQRLHCAVAGRGEQLMLLMHGFPDIWHGWSAQIAHFAGRFTVVAADGRGCNLSDKPAEMAEYALPRLVADAGALIAHYGRGRPAIVVGHDWGGVVGWALASLHVELLSHLVALSAPHPCVLARALAEDPRQREASGYMRRLREPDAEKLLSADGFARLRAALDSPPGAGEDSAAQVAACVEAWSRPGALTGALNWYRANDFGAGGTAVHGIPAAVPVPTLLVWGSEDRALLPSLAMQHHSVASRLSVHVLPGAGHWTLRERSREVNALIDAHLGVRP